MPQVAVITRTKNRNLLLARALESVGRQTFTDWVMVIVNDGGDAAAVDALLAGQNLVPPEKRIVLHHPESLGMEAASHAGIAASESKYLIIHDDDDSWSPRFLERTVSFLEAPDNRGYAGVVTHAVKIYEVIEDDVVREVDRELYGATLERIDLHDLAAGNLFAPIQFLYQRAAYQEIGPYRSDLPVLGDWEFNLRFIVRHPIGVVTEPLAYYHHRKTDRHSAYANTIFGGIRKHITTDALLRNEITGRDIAGGITGLGTVIQTARGFGSVYGELRRLEHRIHGLERLFLSGVRDDLRELLRKPRLSAKDAEVIARVVAALPVTSLPATGDNPADTDPTFLRYVAHVREMLSSAQPAVDGEVIVFGASPFGERLVEILKEHGHVVACCFDNSPDKIGSLLADVPVVKPRIILPGSLIVNASINHNVAIHRQIQSLAAGGRSTIVSHEFPLETTA